VKGPDGAYYVSELTGAPFAAGTARIYRLVPGEEPTIFLTGFKTVIDLDFGPDGSLYVLEHASGPVFFGGPGRVIRVAPDGTRIDAVTGLTRPTSVAVDRDGTIYVTNRGISVGIGEVWRIEQ
jgi:glucose/arabinose dehydrogenase